MMNKNHFTDFCVKGLERMYLPSEHVFATHRLVDEKMVPVRDRGTEYTYTMNVLMGLHTARSHGSNVTIDLESDYFATASRLHEHADSPLHIAATFWTGKSLGVKIPPYALSLFEDVLKSTMQKQYPGPKALAWAIVGCLTGGNDYFENAHRLAKVAADRYVNQRTNLVRQVHSSIRENWASFGVHSLISWALLLLARKTGDNRAKEMGLRIARKLVNLQGDKGQWGWMYHVPTGRLTDYYPVFSVHQYGYAAFFLIEAIDQGYEEFRKPFERGFRWILGENELGETMVSREHQLIWRRIIRKPPNPLWRKMLRGASVLAGLQSARLLDFSSAMIDRQCHGFEMALGLRVFSGRDDFGDLLNNPIFS